MNTTNTMTRDVLGGKGLDFNVRPPVTKDELRQMRANVERWVSWGWLKRPEKLKAVPGHGPNGGPARSGAWAKKTIESAATLGQTFSRDDLARALKVTPALAGNYMSQWHGHGWLEHVERGQWRCSESFGV